MKKQLSPAVNAYLFLLLVALIFILDLLTPLGYGAAFFYTLPLLLFFRFHKKNHFVAAALFLTALLMLAVFFKPPPRNFFLPSSVFNRTASIITICILLLAIYRRSRSEQELRKSEGDLKKSERRYRTIFEGSNDPIAVLNMEQRKYLDVNESYCGFTGFSREDVLSNKTGTFFAPPHLQPQTNEIFKRLLEEKALIYDWELQSKTGETIPVQVSSRIVELEGKNYLFSIFRDMRLIKEAEEVLKRDKETLERIVKEKTEALLRAKRLSALGTLAASIAHELRNPLTAIDLAKYNIARKVSDKERIDQYLEVIGKKVQACNQLIDNMLFFSRLKLPECKNVNLHQLLTEVEETALARHKGTDVRLINKTANIADLTVRADPDQIAQVLGNVLNNAYDALTSTSAPVAEKVIKITASYKSGYVSVAVNDNGPGIEPGIAERLFEPFVSTKESGTGLGLAISRQIMENHGGGINIKSEKGKGTTVLISLPRENDSTLS